MHNLDFIECHSTDDKIKNYANEAIAILKDKHLTRNYKERKIKVFQNLIASRIDFLDKQAKYKNLKNSKEKPKSLGDPKQIAAIGKTFKTA